MQARSVQFPNTVIDNFFQDPDAVTSFGKALDFTKTGSYPGLRTKNLKDTHPMISKEIVRKIFNVYFSDVSTISCESVKIYFQNIPKFSEDPKSLRNKGWIHTDMERTTNSSANNNKLAGVIYLTPNARLESGTNICKFKKGINVNLLDHWLQSSSIPLHEQDVSKKTNNPKDLEKGPVYKKEWNNWFDHVTMVGNIYNRIILFDGNEFHCGNNFYHEDEGERLVIVFFLQNVKGGILPKRRISKDNLTEIINAPTETTI
tara:strand:- start:146 stop:925 length:780 start_codon:yes stop_codon:yes gene_type:complete